MADNGTKLRILLLEDDPTISEIVCEFLQESDYKVIAVLDGNDAVDKAYEEHFDAFIFDVKVPSKNGFDVLKELRDAKKSAPAIFITSLSSVDDLSQGYDAGCDDYIKKPFELKELQIRLKKLIKNSFALGGDDKIILNALWSFEPTSGKLISLDESFFLTKKETKILNTLLAHRGKMVTHEQIMSSAWDYDDEATEENLRTHIKKLRKILGKDMIENIRKQGYLLALR